MRSSPASASTSKPSPFDPWSVNTAPRLVKTLVGFLRGWPKAPTSEAHQVLQLRKIPKARHIHRVIPVQIAGWVLRGLQEESKCRQAWRLHIPRPLPQAHLLQNHSGVTIGQGLFRVREARKAIAQGISPTKRSRSRCGVAQTGDGPARRPAHYCSKKAKAS